VILFFHHRLDGGNNKKLVMELVECNEMGIMKIGLLEWLSEGWWE
jgi:hypothetical protein